MGLVVLGLLTVFNAREFAMGSSLARGFCGNTAVFWGVRISLQAVLKVKEHLTTWWLAAGYHLLTIFCLYFTVIFASAALRPVA